MTKAEMNNMEGNSIYDSLGSAIPRDWKKNEAKITVLGVGGGGCNAVNYMFKQGIDDCSFLVCNTDSQALSTSLIENKVQIGRGLGAGTDPIEGRKAAEESAAQIENAIKSLGTEMLFITAGMGGGTGTGASPVIAEIARKNNILVVGVVTMPFLSDGNDCFTRAIDGVHELQKHIDSLIIINNEKLHEAYGDMLVHEALPLVDNVLATAVRCIIEIIKKPGYINVDFKDVCKMLRGGGIALMGYGEGHGENRIEEAVKSAFESPLLNDFDLKSSQRVLVNVTIPNTEKGVTMSAIEEVNKRIDSYTDSAKSFKRGIIYEDDPDFGDTVRVCAIVTGLKFSDSFGPSRDMGNYIMIDRDFEYSDTPGVLGSDDDYININQIGLNTKKNFPKFDYSDKPKPCLLVDYGENLSELENTPAIRRHS